MFNCWSHWIWENRLRKRKAENKKKKKLSPNRFVEANKFWMLEIRNANPFQFIHQRRKKTCKIYTRTERCFCCYFLRWVTTNANKMNLREKRKNFSILIKFNRFSMNTRLIWIIKTVCIHLYTFSISPEKAGKLKADKWNVLPFFDLSRYLRDGESKLNKVNLNLRLIRYRNYVG